jgi:hypothetical protein
MLVNKIPEKLYVISYKKCLLAHDYVTFAQKLQIILQILFKFRFIVLHLFVDLQLNIQNAYSFL